MNRRSFLGLLAGAVLAKPVSKAGPVVLKNRAMASLAPLSGDYWMPFMISDSANLQPGEIADVVLFGGEQPAQFRLNGIGLQIAAPTSVKDCNILLDGTWAELKHGAMMLIKGPLWVIGRPFGMTSLPCPVEFQGVEPFSAPYLQ